MNKMEINEVTRRLKEVNTFLATNRQDNVSFDDALLLSRFYCDCKDTNGLVEEAESSARENIDRLMSQSVFLFSEAELFLNTDKGKLREVDFEDVFKQHTAPFEHQYKIAKELATGLWNKYSTAGNRLDFLPLESDDYQSLDRKCNTLKAEYDKAHENAIRLYDEWKQEEQRSFCVYCFRMSFLDVLVSRIRGIADSIIHDIRRIKEG